MTDQYVSQRNYDIPLIHEILRSVDAGDVPDTTTLPGISSAVIAAETQAVLRMGYLSGKVEPARPHWASPVVNITGIPPSGRMLLAALNGSNDTSCPPTPSAHIVPVPHRSSFQTDVNRYIQGRQLDHLHTSIECPACGHVLRRSYRDLATSAPHHCPACHITFRVDRCLVMKRYNHILAQRRTREHELDEPVTSTPPVLLRPSVPALPLVEDLLRNRRELTSG